MLSRKDQKFIKSLKVKKYRTREECFLVEGTKNVLELVKSDYKIEFIVGTEIFFEAGYDFKKIRTELIKKDLLTQLSSFKTNEDVLAVAKTKYWELESMSLNDHVFVLDGVNDPGNMGTIIRTLDWFGFNQLICSKDCADFFNPKTINSSMGSFTRIKLFSVDLAYFYEKNRLPVFGADMDGKSIFEKKISEHAVFVMGSESNGLSQQSRTEIKDYISIPRFGRAESLNVGIATAILASHLRMS